MRAAIKTGFSFGLTSSIITTLGLMIGLNAGTGSRLAVIGAIITIAVADAMSDAMGIHISEESKKNNTEKNIWIATISTFLTKFVFTLTFTVPVLLFPLDMAMKIAIVWGILLLAIFSYFLAKKKKTAPWKVITEHVSIALLVVIISHSLGHWVARVFG